MTWILPAVVAIALVVGFMRAQWRAGDGSLPSFAPPSRPQLAELRVPRGNATLRGRVVDIDGAGVGAVELYLRSNGVPQWVTSDAEGRFAFSELAPGEVEVVVLKWGHPPRTERLATGADEREIVLLPANPPPPRVPSVASAPFSGRVAHPLGLRWSDPEGYEVVLVPRAPANELGGAVERRTRSDARGFFALDALALGSYRVMVLPSWARGGSWPDLALPDFAELEHSPESVDANIFPLACGALEGELHDEHGAPIEGAFVLLASADSPSRVWLPQTSDPLGRFRFLDLPPGPYALQLRAGEARPPEVLFAVEQAVIATPELPPLSVRKRE